MFKNQLVTCQNMFCPEIIRFLGAGYRIDIKSVRTGAFHGSALNKFVSPVRRVPGVKAYHLAPVLLPEKKTGLLRAKQKSGMVHQQVE